jgi:hypothetical protein
MGMSFQRGGARAICLGTPFLMNVTHSRAYLPLDAAMDFREASIVVYPHGSQREIASCTIRHNVGCYLAPHMRGIVMLQEVRLHYLAIGSQPYVNRALHSFCVW